MISFLNLWDYLGCLRLMPRISWSGLRTADALRWGVARGTDHAPSCLDRSWNASVKGEMLLRRPISLDRQGLLVYTHTLIPLNLWCA